MLRGKDCPDVKPDKGADRVAVKGPVTQQQHPMVFDSSTLKGIYNNQNTVIANAYYDWSASSHLWYRILRSNTTAVVM